MQLSRAPSRAASLPLAIACAFLPQLSRAQAITLAPTIVTAPRFAEPAQPLPFGVSVVTAADIARSGATTINEALMRVLGVVGRQDLYGGGEYAIDLRGFGSTADNNQVVIVDGLRVSEADLGGTRLAGIPIESVERIEVLRGSGAVLYGEGATGGVIVITTKAGTGKERPNGASLYAGAGSNRLRDLRATANVGAGGFSLDASVQKRESDGYRDNFSYQQDGSSLRAQWANEWLRAAVYHAQDKLDTGLPGALSAAQYAANPRQTTTPTDHADIRNARTGASVEASWASWQFGLDVGSRDKQLRSLNAFGPFDYDVDARNTSLRARNESSLGGGRNAFVIGMDRSRWTREVLGTFGSTARQDSRAWYLKDDFTFAGGTRVSAGWRTERIEKDSSNALAGFADRLNAWEFGASHPLGGGATLYGRVGRSFRLANVDEFGFTAFGAMLRPQTSRDIEAGARWQDAKTKLDARLYRSALTDEIGFDPNITGPFPGFFGANANFDPTRREGLELDASHQLLPTLGLRANAGLRKSTFRSGPYAGRDVPLAPRRTLALRADWTPAAAHRVGGGVNWVSSQHPDFDNACSMPAYTVADVRYAYTWRNAELSLGVTNLADRKYYTQAYACFSGATQAIYPEAGRAFTAAVRVNF